MDVGKERKVIKLKAYYVEMQIKKEKRKVTVDRRKKRNESKKDIRGRETDEKGQSRADTHSLIMTNIYKVCFSISSRNTPSELRSFPTRRRALVALYELRFILPKKCNGGS